MTTLYHNDSPYWSIRLYFYWQRSTPQSFLGILKNVLQGLPGEFHENISSVLKKRFYCIYTASILIQVQQFQTYFTSLYRVTPLWKGNFYLPKYFELLQRIALHKYVLLFIIIKRVSFMCTLGIFTFLEHSNFGDA